MQYKQVISKVADTTGLTQKEVKLVVTALVGVTTEELAKGGTVWLPQLGTLKVRENRRTSFVLKGKSYPVKHKRIAAFSPAATLLEALV